MPAQALQDSVVNQLPDRSSFIQSAVDTENNLVRVKYSGRITPELMRAHLDELDEILPSLEDEFVVLTDLSDLEWMDVRCTPHLSAVMDKYTAGKVSAVVRIIPDPTKDIGFSILSILHYPEGVRIVTCESAEEAEDYLFG